METIKTETTIQVLLIEDDFEDQMIVRDILSDQTTLSVDLVNAKLLADGARCAREGRFDVVLLDLSLPDSVGLGSLTSFIEAAPDMPVIVLTGIDDVETAVKAVNHGARDYLVKWKFAGDLLQHTIQHVVKG